MRADGHVRDYHRSNVPAARIGENRAIDDKSNIMSREERDPYSLLGLRHDASPAEISRAFRRAARVTHPDSRPGDPAAAERFNAVTAAYETLRDPRRRAAYDQAHAAVRSVAHAHSGARAVRWATPRPAATEVTVGFSLGHTARGAPLRAGPVEIVPPARPRPAPPAWADNDLTDVAAYVTRWLGGGC